MSDLKHAVRTLSKTPFITGVAILSLALGIGANAAIFSLFDQILLSTVPAAEPGELVNLAFTGPNPGSQSCNNAGGCDEIASYPMFRDLERESPGLAGVAAHRAFGANLARGERTLDGEGMMVSGSYFSLLGLRPALGRLLQPADDQVPGEHPVAVLGHDYWQNELGGDPDVLNSTVVINGHTMTVVGVAPDGFMGTTLGVRPDVYVPISMRAEVQPAFGDGGFDDRRVYWAYLFGRLDPGGTIEQAEAELNALYSSIINETEAALQEGMSETTMAEFRAKRVVLSEGGRGQSDIHEEARTPLMLLLGITAVVLLIACANIANLLLARGAHRSTEMAVRGSLGATRRQLLRQLLTESLLLAAAGGVASLLVARGTLAAMGSLMPPEAAEVLTGELRPGVLLFIMALVIGTGILFGLYPALHASRTDLATTIRSGSGQTAGARSAARFRTGLVTAQIALSMTLLVAAGLFVRSLANVSRVDLGLETAGMVTFGISPELNGYEPEQSRMLFERLERELAAIPGVTGVTASMVPVLAGSSWGTDVAVQGFESGPDIDDNSRYNHVGPGFFSTMGTPLIAGREFTEADALGGSKVAIVNEAFARKFGLEGREAVGAFMSIHSGPDSELDMQIVGLVQDAKYNSVRDEIPPVFYEPYRQNERLGFINYYVRTDGPTGPILRAIPDVMKRIDPNLPVEELKTFRQQVRENVALDRMISVLTAAFAVLATLLAAIGLYGVLAYTVAQRTREIGLRMALGAASPTIRKMIIRQVAGMLVVGGVVGLVAALALGRAAASLLYQLEGHDPIVLVAAVALLSLVAFGAGFVPAFRASRVNPMRALRYE
jgi:predicted permease